MEIYKNDYSKNEDFMMFELHEIRNKMAKENNSIEKINNDALKIIEKYNLKNVKILQRT
jgi:hypothetical protein